MQEQNSSTDRRTFLLGATAAVAAAAVPTTASAMKNHEHHHHGPNKKLVDAAEECVATGKTCLNHCLVLLGVGDTSMKECAKSVNEMIPVCEAMGSLALAKSKNLKIMAEACLAVCKDCAAACKEHIADHDECNDCYKSCNHAIEVVEAYLKAA